ncbi:MAG TPA: NADH-quinone oxidoreductase subunit H [Candidatus Sumerlaeota bacterium]|nr:NADH-quinone oxidoreductase subunit H [Candidatus Sumerlaeota bacterium]HPS02977.1 NADH-quinone oxidoreductase subunit H [Candidatus Sumerlaeota bacterium]
MQDAIQQIHSGVFGLLWPEMLRLPTWLVLTAGFVVGGALVLVWMALMALAWTYGERRIAGFIQVRYGPNRVGPLGLLQPVADGIKCFSKEDTVPTVAYKFMYTLAPLLVFLGAMLPFAALPFSQRLVLADMPLGLYYVLAFEAIEVIGILMAGWAPGSKWSLYGGMRLAAQLLSYEIPMGLCALVIILLSGSLNLGEIVTWQSQNAWGLEHPWVLGWAIFRSPVTFIAFVIFFVAGLAASKRAPFDLPEAESELVAGYHTEYSGLRFSFFFMAEYTAMYVVCALSAVLFLGGWYGPVPMPDVAPDSSLAARWVELVGLQGLQGDLSMMQKIVCAGRTLCEALFQGEGLRILASEAIGLFNLLLKAFGLYFVMIWVRWTLPRVRIDQVMYLCLKVLLPFSLVCLIWALIQVALF